MPFQLRPEHLTFVRGKRMTEALAATFAGSSLNAKPEPASGTVSVSHPNAPKPTVFALDDQGFVGRITTPLGRQWNIVSNEAGRATNITNPGGSTAFFSYDDRGRLNGVGRDTHWLFHLEQDTANNLTQVSYADHTREVLTYKDHKYLTNVTRRTQISESFEYDKQNCLTAIVDGKGNRTRYEYGRWNRPDRARFADGSLEEYQYDERGHLKSFARGGVHADVTADKDGRVCELAYAGGDRIKRKFGESGELTAVESKAGEIRWEYQQGRVVRETSASADAEYIYDERQRLIGLVYPDGSRVSFAWDEDDRLASISDWSGSETKWQYANGERGWAVVYASGARAGTAVAPTGVAKQIVVNGPEGGAGLLRLTYTHDAEDRVSSCEDTLAGSAREFRYDSDGRLLQSAGQSFSYDAADNLVMGHFGAAEFNAANQPVMVAGGTVCLHDARGNLTEGVAKDGIWQLLWDEQNRLAEARGPAGQKIEYGYDGLGRRAWRKEGESHTEYFWAGETQIGEIERRNGQVVRRQEYLFIPGTYTLFATRINGEVFYAHCDHLGTPRLLTNSKGHAAWAATYDAWGVTEKVWGETVHQPWRFPGQYADAATELCDNRFRVYSPYLGRYLSRDPLGYADGLNLYAYAKNDPVNGADPLGLFSWGTLGVIAASVAVGIAVVALAPVALPLAIILAGAAAGAVGFGLNEALNEKSFCATCIALAALKGAAIGAVAAIPFAIAPEVGGVALFAGRGGASGALGYFGAVAGGAQFSWAGLGKSVLIGAATGGAGKYLAGRLSPASERIPQDVARSPEPPSPLSLNRPVSKSSLQNAEVQSDIQQARAEGGTDFRVNQEQVNAAGERVGQNRPDLQYTDANGNRVYVEYDSPTSGRGPGHADRLLANDPDGTVVLKTVDDSSGSITSTTETTSGSTAPIGPATVGAVTGSDPHD